MNGGVFFSSIENKGEEIYAGEFFNTSNSYITLGEDKKYVYFLNAPIIADEVILAVAAFDKKTTTIGDANELNDSYKPKSIKKIWFDRLGSTLDVNGLNGLLVGFREKSLGTFSVEFPVFISSSFFNKAERIIELWAMGKKTTQEKVNELLAMAEKSVLQGLKSLSKGDEYTVVADRDTLRMSKSSADFSKELDKLIANSEMSSAPASSGGDIRERIKTQAEEALEQGKTLLLCYDGAVGTSAFSPKKILVYGDYGKMYGGINDDSGEYAVIWKAGGSYLKFEVFSNRQFRFTKQNFLHTNIYDKIINQFVDVPKEEVVLGKIIQYRASYMLIGLASEELAKDELFVFTPIGRGIDGARISNQDAENIVINPLMTVKEAKKLTKKFPYVVALNIGSYPDEHERTVSNIKKAYKLLPAKVLGINKSEALNPTRILDSLDAINYKVRFPSSVGLVEKELAVPFESFIKTFNTSALDALAKNEKTKLVRDKLLKKSYEIGLRSGDLVTTIREGDEGHILNGLKISARLEPISLKTPMSSYENVLNTYSDVPIGVYKGGQEEFNSLVDRMRATVSIEGLSSDWIVELLQGALGFFKNHFLSFDQDIYGDNKKDDIKRFDDFRMLWEVTIEAKSNFNPPAYIKSTIDIDSTNGGLEIRFIQLEESVWRARFNSTLNIKWTGGLVTQSRKIYAPNEISAFYLINFVNRDILESYRNVLYTQAVTKYLLSMILDMTKRKYTSLQVAPANILWRLGEGQLYLKELKKQVLPINLIEFLLWTSKPHKKITKVVSSVLRPDGITWSMTDKSRVLNELGFFTREYLEILKSTDIRDLAPALEVIQDIAKALYVTPIRNAEKLASEGIKNPYLNGSIKVNLDVGRMLAKSPVIGSYDIWYTETQDTDDGGLLYWDAEFISSIKKQFLNIYKKFYPEYYPIISSYDSRNWAMFEKAVAEYANVPLPRASGTEKITIDVEPLEVIERKVQNKKKSDIESAPKEQPQPDIAMTNKQPEAEAIAKEIIDAAKEEREDDIQEDIETLQGNGDSDLSMEEAANNPNIENLIGSKVNFIIGSNTQGTTKGWTKDDVLDFIRDAIFHHLYDDEFAAWADLDIRQEYNKYFKDNVLQPWIDEPNKFLNESIIQGESFMGKPSLKYFMTSEQAADWKAAFFLNSPDLPKPVKSSYEDYLQESRGVEPKKEDSTQDDVDLDSLLDDIDELDKLFDLDGMSDEMTEIDDMFDE